MASWMVGRGLRKRVILSADFCKQMLRLAKAAQTMRLAVRKDHALFLADDSCCTDASCVR